jgi:hypothetical protein
MTPVLILSSAICDDVCAGFRFVTPDNERIQRVCGLIPKLSKRDSEGGFPNRRVSDSRWRAQEVRHAHSTSG